MFTSKVPNVVITGLHKSASQTRKLLLVRLHLNPPFTRRCEKDFRASKCGVEQYHFQHDRVLCHKTIVIPKWLEEQNIEIFYPWPGNSLDLNPFENLRSILKRRIDKQNSDKLQYKHSRMSCQHAKHWLTACQGEMQRKGQPQYTMETSDKNI